jgi:hypothetical protein
LGKYATLDSDIFSVFASALWKAEKIAVYPANFVKQDSSTEFVRVSIIPSGNGVNLKSVSGVLIADIFTLAGDGPKKTSSIADRLDAFLCGKTKSANTGKSVQFFSSTLSPSGADKDNRALYRATYTIPFNYSEALQ